jgi:hypothetical protein
MFARYSGTIVRITLDIHTNEIATLYIYICSFRFMYTRSNNYDNNNRLNQVQALLMNKQKI